MHQVKSVIKRTPRLAHMQRDASKDARCSCSASPAWAELAAGALLPASQLPPGPRLCECPAALAAAARQAQRIQLLLIKLVLCKMYMWLNQSLQKILLG